MLFQYYCRNACLRTSYGKVEYSMPPLSPQTATSAGLLIKGAHPSTFTPTLFTFACTFNVLSDFLQMLANLEEETPLGMDPKSAQARWHLKPCYIGNLFREWAREHSKTVRRGMHIKSIVMMASLLSRCAVSARALPRFLPWFLPTAHN